MTDAREGRAQFTPEAKFFAIAKDEVWVISRADFPLKVAANGDELAEELLELVRQAAEYSGTSVAWYAGAGLSGDGPDDGIRAYITFASDIRCLLDGRNCLSGDLILVDTRGDEYDRVKLTLAGLTHNIMSEAK